MVERDESQYHFSNRIRKELGFKFECLAFVDIADFAAFFAKNVGIATKQIGVLKKQHQRHLMKTQNMDLNTEEPTWRTMRTKKYSDEIFWALMRSMD